MFCCKDNFDLYIINSFPGSLLFSPPVVKGEPGDKVDGCSLMA